MLVERPAEVLSGKQKVRAERQKVQPFLPSWNSDHLDNRRHSLRVSAASMTHTDPAESSGGTLDAENYRLTLEQKQASGTQEITGMQVLGVHNTINCYSSVPREAAETGIEFVTRQACCYLKRSRVLHKVSHLCVTV